MKRFFNRANLNASILAALLAIPMITLKINASKPVTGPTVSECEWEPTAAIETLPEIKDKVPYYGYSFIETEEETTTELETETIIVTEEIVTLFSNPYVALPAEQQDIIKSVCDEYGLCYELVMAVGYQESRWNMGAYNPVSGDYGMFQINESSWNNTANAIGLYNYKYDLAENTAMCCYILRYCLTVANGDLRVALNYYRTGTPNAKYEAGSDYASIIFAKMAELGN